MTDLHLTFRDVALIITSLCVYRNNFCSEDAAVSVDVLIKYVLDSQKE